MQLNEFWGDLADDLDEVLSGYRDRRDTLDVRTKPDHTPVTEADTAVQDLIVDRIRRLDPNAVIIAEEDGRQTERADVADDPEYIWVIDPIDGTYEFTRPDGHEYCTVVCLLERREPVNAFIFAPELGVDGRPLVVSAERAAGFVCVNGTPVPQRERHGKAKSASVTRRAGTEPRPFEEKLAAAGYELKTQATSLSLDMLRTAVDLRPFSDEPQPRFDLFHRERQKVWDGVAGLCLGATVGLRVSDGSGAELVPLPLDMLIQAEPKFDATIMGTTEAVESFLEIR